MRNTTAAHVAGKGVFVMQRTAKLSRERYVEKKVSDVLEFAMTLMCINIVLQVL